MSDTYGADDSDQSIADQADTASGGLQNDVPGLPTQPSSRPGPRPPSALGGLAGAARQMFGGGSAPRPAGPGRSPFEFPGQSQIPQGPTGGPQSHQNASRWMGTTASLGLPRGSMQPQANFTPFMPGQPTTSYRQWGQDQPFADLPQPFETPSIYGNLSNFFGKNGSAAIIPLALSMGKNGASFLDGIMKGQEWRAKMHRNQMEDDARELELRQGQELSEYYNIVDEYETAAGAKSSGAVGGYTIKGQTMLDALANKATELGDDQFLGVLGTGNVEKALQFVHRRNDNWQTLSKANDATEKQRIEDEKWGLTPPTQTGGVGAKAEGAGQTQAAAPSQPAPQTARGEGAPAPAQATAPQGTSLIDSGADEIFKGIEPGTYVPPDVKDEMARRAAGKRIAAGNILHNPNLKPDQVLPEVERQLGPTVAADLKGYSQYRAGPGATGQASGGKEQDYWNLLGDLAQKMLPGDPANNKPGWNKSTYQAVRDFREQAQKPNSPIQRIPTSVEAANNVLNDLDAIQRRWGPNAPSINSPEDFQGWMGKDPLFAQLKIDWIRYNEDIDVLTRGTPSVGMAEQAIGTQPQFPYLGSLSGYRAAVRRDMDQAQSRVKQLHGTWEQYQTGDVMPGFNRQAEEDMERIKRLDYNTGAKPGDVKTLNGVRARYTGANPEDPSDQSNWEPVE